MRVLVVRPEARSAETAVRLAARAHDPLVAPVLSIRTTASSPPASAFDALLVTSRHALPALTTHRERLAAAEVFAVGAKTGAALGQAGFHPVHVARSDAAGLAALVRERIVLGARLLHAAGRERRPEPAASLRALGFVVEPWVTYAAEAVDRLPEAVRIALARKEIDAILHYSPRSATILARLVEEAGRGEAWRRPLHACLSANVAAALGDEGAARPGTLRIAVAAEPTEDAILALLDAAERTD